QARHRLELAEGAHVEVADARLHVAAGQADVLPADGPPYVLDGEAGGLEAVAPHPDLDLAVHAAADLDGADARQLLEALRQLALEDARAPLEVEAAGHRHRDDGARVGI